MRDKFTAADILYAGVFELFMKSPLLEGKRTRSCRTMSPGAYRGPPAHEVLREISLPHSGTQYTAPPQSK
jgi:hypothetical protein